MDLKELLTSLMRQEENLNLLLTVVGHKQKAIIEGKIEKIEEAIFEEEKLFKSIGAQEKNRIEMLQSYSQKLGLSAAHNHLNDFLVELRPRLDPKFFSEMQSIRANIIELVNNINHINQQNKILIAQSIHFVKNTITSLVDARKNSLVDRRM
jgi:flagellar biosynthesis/type III secretory pathway chaperone